MTSPPRHAARAGRCRILGALLLGLPGFACAADKIDRFSAADTDGNGQLSRAEAARGLPEVASAFERIDADGNGQVSPDELRAWLRSQKGRAARPASADTGLAAYFRKADADGDGLLTRAEAQQGLPRIAVKFDEIDIDADGRLSLIELQGYFKAKQGAAKAR